MLFFTVINKNVFIKVKICVFKPSSVSQPSYLPYVLRLIIFKLKCVKLKPYVFIFNYLKE